MKRTAYWDIVKGIAITAVVIGHASPVLHDFVYTWHLSIFVFLTGYLYNTNMYEQHPWEYMGHKTGQNWPKYVGYSSIILGIYLILNQFGIVEGKTFTSKKLFFEWIDILFFSGSFSLQGTLWFVPMLLLCTGMFCTLIYWQKRLAFMKGDILVLIISFVIGICGIWITNKGIDLKYFLNISMLMLPVCVCGYICRKICSDFPSLLVIPLGVIGIIINCFFAYILNWDINLAANNTAGYKFYFVTLVGIYSALTLAKVLENLKVLRISFAFLGKYSFEIMAFHFSIFKIIDFIYAKAFPGKVTLETIAAFPTAGVTNSIVYIVLGCIVPAFTCHFIGQIIKKKLKRESQYG